MRTMPCQRRGRPAQRGLTLVESAVATAVVAVAAGAVAPGLTEMRLVHALAQAAAGFETDAQQARSLAVAGNAPWRIAFGGTAGRTCYVVYRGAADDCACDGSGQATCRTGTQAERTVTFADGDPIAMRANVPYIVFDPLKGTSTPAGAVTLSLRSGKAIRQVVNIMGRVRSCSPERSVPGYKAC